MPLHFYDGAAFSGRSEALKEFAWNTAPGGGCYVHPMLEMNLSGLAETVAGELYLHGVGPQAKLACLGDLAQLLTDKLPRLHTLRTLSGGEAARLVLGCALATSPDRLSLDCTLEQLDPSSRHDVLTNVLLPTSRTMDVRIADNNGSDLATVADVYRPFSARDALDLNGPLFELSKGLAGEVAAPCIELDSLSFRYRGSLRAIFEKASFSFQPGVPYILKAPNGAGKSTLARLLLGVLQPDRGSIRVGGVDVGSAAGRNKNLLFYAFQNPIVQMIANRTAAYLALVEKRADRRDTWLRGSLDLGSSTVLSGFGLETFGDTEPFDLPFTVLKRLSIAASLLSRSPWLFFDEPALASDAMGRKALASYFSALCDIGFGVILISHGTEFDGLPGAHPVTIRNGQLEGGQDGI
jgi:ABC-type multidrug transport system ATPase subunit